MSSTGRGRSGKSKSVSKSKSVDSEPVVKLARVEFESKSADKEETSKSVKESGSSSKMARTKQTPRKRVGEFKCHVCGEVFTQSCNRKRHLAKH